MNGNCIEAVDFVPARSGLEPLTWNVPQGAVVCLLGREPQLRSAWLRALAGAEYPRAGTLSLLGRPLDTLDDRSWLALRREVGLVTREAPLVSSMDALRNVMLPALYHGLGKRPEVEAQAREWLSRLGFHGNEQLLPAYLSDEECRLVALARALMLAPKLLLVDELLQGWHGNGLREVMPVVAQWCRESGTALVHVTDDVAFVRAWADEILFVAAPRPRVFQSWSAFHDAIDLGVQRYFSEFRNEAMAFD